MPADTPSQDPGVGPSHSSGAGKEPRPAADTAVADDPGTGPDAGPGAGRRPPPGPGTRRRRWKPKEWGLAAIFLAPSLAVFGAFFFYALWRLVDLSLHRQNRTGTAQRWEGLAQWREVLTSSDFLDGLWITVQFVLYTVPAGLVLGVLLAVTAHRRLRGIKIFQTIFASTIASSVAVASVVFFTLVNPTAGYFRDVGFISLADPDTAMRGVALSSIWQNLGLTFIIVLAGLQAIPQEIEEASLLDGFGPVQKFFRITLPLLSPTLLFLVVVLTIFGFQAFAQIDILTSGGPAGSTETLVFKIFNSQQPSLVGEGAVMAIGLFAITVVVAFGQFLILEKRVHYGD
jgi:sn-glycerol 3-phosphate transport system permease protein